MANVAVTNTFSGGTKAKASEVNTNFSDLVTYINNRNGASSQWDALSVLGTATFSSVLRAADGAVGAPAYSWTLDTDTGIYRAGGNSFSLVTNGVDRLIINTTLLSCLLPLGQQGGTQTEPQYTWSNDLDTGLWHSALDAVAVTCGGTTRFTFSTASHTSTVPIRLSDGSVSAPSLTFASDTNTGLVWNSADSASFQSGGGVAAGGSSITVTNSGVDISCNNAIYVLGINGSVNNDMVCQIANGSSGVSAVSVFSATTGRGTCLIAAFGANYSDTRCGQAAADAGVIEFGGTNLSRAIIVTQTSASMYFGTNQTEAAHIDTSQVWTFAKGPTFTAGDTTFSEAGKGPVLKTPDGSHTYRVAIDNNGMLTTTQLT